MSGLRKAFALRMCSLTLWPSLVFSMSLRNFSSISLGRLPGGEGGSSNATDVPLPLGSAATASPSDEAPTALGSEAAFFLTTEICTPPTRRCVACCTASSSSVTPSTPVPLSAAAGSASPSPS